MVVTIDGPSGAGKSSVSKELARKLEFAFLDSGALYRTLALAALWDDMEEPDEDRVALWLPGVRLSAQPQKGRFLVLLDGREVESFIRNEQIGGIASRMSSMRPVRQYLLNVQRRAAELGDLVAEGRDMGTVIFPDAQAKFFLTANAEERARRRMGDLLAQNQEVELESVLEQIRQRDARDVKRSLSPLVPAQDAEVLDSSDMTRDQVVQYLMQRVGEIRSRL